MKSISLRELAKQLFLDLNKNDDDIFKTDLIIVPSKKIESYIKSYFLREDNNGDVLMNINIKTLSSLLLEQFGEKYDLADKSYIRSLIIKYLSEKKIDQLESYFSDSKTKGINIYDVADKLTSAFQFYDDNLVDLGSFDESNSYQKDIYEHVEEDLKSSNLVTLAMLNKIEPDYKIDAYLFGFTKYTKLEESVISKYIDVIEVYDLIKDTAEIDINNITKIVKAPNKIREIEALHSDICKRIKEDKSLKFSDFLVISNNLSEYVVDINRVFNQDNKGYPVIPFYIGEANEVVNETNNLLNLLFRIGKKSYFTRQDLSDVLDSYLTKKINNLDDEDIEVIKKSILDLNIYRKKEDWDYFIKRLEVSKICDINDEDDFIILSSGEAIPFTQIGLNDKNMNSIINIIKNLYTFIDIFKNETHDIDLIKGEIEKWLSVKEFDIEKNGYFRKIIDILEFWKKEKINAKLDTLFYNLIDLTNQTRSNKGSLYSSGVSFTSFDPYSILEAKYIYFIGASSENLPILKEKNPFDASNIKLDYKDEENAFYLYCLNADKLYFSYVYKNLKENQEQYFLSTFVKKIYKSREVKYTMMPLDETRDYEDITTKRGMDNKDYINNLMKNSSITTPISGTPNYPILDKLTTSKMGEFLNEPLSFRANQLFGRNDDLDENIGDEFEPFTVDGGDRASIFKEILLNELLSVTKDLKHKLILENRLPHIQSAVNHIETKEYDKIAKDVEEYITFIGGIRDGHDYDLICKTKYINDPTIGVLNDVKYPDFTVTNNYDVLRIKKANEWIYVPLKVLTKIRGKDILSAYIIALCDIIQSINGANDVTISIYQKQIDNDKVHTYKYTEAIKAVHAKDLLEKIFSAINDYSGNYSKFFDSNLLFNGTEFDAIKSSIKSLVEKVDAEKGGYWSYFDSKKLFDLFNQLGYGNDYIKEIEKMRDRMNELIIIKQGEV